MLTPCLDNLGRLLFNYFIGLLDMLLLGPGGANGEANADVPVQAGLGKHDIISGGYNFKEAGVKVAEGFSAEVFPTLLRRDTEDSQGQGWFSEQGQDLGLLNQLDEDFVHVDCLEAT